MENGQSMGMGIRKQPMEINDETRVNQGAGQKLQNKRKRKGIESFQEGEGAYRRDAQNLPWNLLAAFCPCYRSSCLRLNEAPSITGLLHRATSPSFYNILETQHMRGEWGKHGGVVALTFKWGWMGQREARLTGEASGLLHCWHVLHELRSAVRCRLPLVHLLSLPSLAGSRNYWRDLKSCFTADSSTTPLLNGFRIMERHGTKGKLPSLAKALEVKSHLYNANSNGADLQRVVSNFFW